MVINECSCRLKFAGWGNICKTSDPTSVEPLETKYECDAGRGLSCKTYQQGKLCGCSAALSFDQRSGECRRKVGSPCHLMETKEEYDSRPFNHKCHENAECVIYSGTLLGGKSSGIDRKEKGSSPKCLCKQGYIASPGLLECRDPNGGSALEPLGVFFLLIFGLGSFVLRS